MILDIHSHTDKLFSIRNFRHLEPISTNSQFYSLGVHPWDSDKFLEEQNFTEFTNNLSEKNCVALGECGLDRLKGVPLTCQIEIFIKQLDIAKRLNKPVIIHCVKAFNELMAIRKRYSELKFIVHGFRGKRALYEQLVKANIAVSFGTHLLKNKELQELFKQIPSDQLFLESDEANEFEFNQLLQFAAQLKNVSLDTFKEQLVSNNKHFFNL